MINDKKTIGLTAENIAIADRIMEKEHFKDRMDVAKFAMSYAINRGVSKGNSEGTETIWNVGSFDADGEIKLIIETIYPDVDMPYRLVEYLCNEGLRLIGEKLTNSSDIDVISLLTE